MKEWLEKIICCPFCKGKLHIEDIIICLSCGRKYNIENKIINFYIGEEIMETKSKYNWKLDDFEKSYEKLGYYESAREHAIKSGQSPLVIDYAYPKVKGRMAEQLEPKDGDIILDVGCGVGYFIFDILKRYEDRELYFVGVDVSKNRIKWVIYRSEKEKKENIIGLVANAEHLPFCDKSFDKIVCSEVIEHIANSGIAISEMARVLKDNSVLLISTPSKYAVDFWDNLFYYPRKIRRFLKGIKDKTPSRGLRYDYPLDEKIFLKYINNAGLKIEKYEKNVLLPNEPYFIAFSEFSTKVIITMCGFLEKNFPFIFKKLMLHFVVKCRK